MSLEPYQGAMMITNMPANSAMRTSEFRRNIFATLARSASEGSTAVDPAISDPRLRFGLVFRLGAAGGEVIVACRYTSSQASSG